MIQIHQRWPKRMDASIEALTHLAYRRFTKSILRLTVLVVLAMAAIACTEAPTEAPAPTGTPEDEPVNIAFLTAVQQNSYVAVVFEEMQRVADEMNATITVFDAEFDVDKQVGQCQDALASGQYDAFIILPIDTSVIPCIEEAIAQGIKVVSQNFPLGPDYTTADTQVEGQTASVMRVTTADGEGIGELIVGACEGIDPCEVGIIEGVLSGIYSITRLEATKSVLDQHPNIELVATGEGIFARDPAIPVAQDMLLAHPGLDVIATGGDQMTIGAEQAVESAGLTGQVKLTGVGASRLGVEAVREGRWYGTTTWVPIIEGRLSAEFAIGAVRGEDFLHEGIDETVYSGYPVIVTLDTLEDFPPDFSGQWEG